jgi:16S rRNA (cytosine967-C5)-methyltransferase
MNEYLSANQALLAVTDQGKSLDGSLTGSSLARQIAFGVLRHYFELASKVDCLVSKPLPEKNADIQLLIMSGIYSIDHLNRPVHASVNACVEATSDLNKVWAKKLVNGVLRSYLRKKDQIVGQIQADRESVTNHPQWFISRIEAAYPDQALAIFEANNVQPPMTLRVNLKQQSREEYLESLASIDIDACIGRHAPTAIYLSRPVAVDKLPNFDTGAASVQDEASQLVAPMMDIAAGMDVLDACAAPGGKSCHILETFSDINLIALDRDKRRLERVKENVARLQLNCQTVADDLKTFEPPNQLFDRILLDAPCSASGIIRRHPDIKLLRRDTDIAKLAETQLELLAKAWSLLKEEGELIYSTCSILPDENEMVVATFCSENPAAKTLSIDAQWGVASAHGRYLLPVTGSSDGFFYAKLKKQTP